MTTETNPKYNDYRIVKKTRGNGEVFYCVEKYTISTYARYVAWMGVEFTQTSQGLSEVRLGQSEFSDVAPLCDFVKRKKEEKRIEKLKQVVSTEVIACCSEPRSIN